MFSHIKPQLIMLQLCTVCQNNPLNLANILQVKNNTKISNYSLYEGKYSGPKHMVHPVHTVFIVIKVGRRVCISRNTP